MHGSLSLFAQRLAGFQPFKRRPTGLYSRPVPELLTPRYKQMRDRDDPCGSSPLSHTIVKFCAVCNRSRMVPIQEKLFFHRCCDNTEMKVRGTLKNAFETPTKITRLLRTWDFANDRPHCNPRRPRPKGRSKFKK